MREGTKGRGLNPSIPVNYFYCSLLWSSLRTAFPAWIHTLEPGTGEAEARRSCPRAGSPEQANTGLPVKCQNTFTKLQITVHIKLLRSQTIREN